MSAGPRVVSLVTGILIALSAGPPATAKKEMAFPDGTWEGRPVLWRGSVSEGAVFAEGTADVNFALTAADGAVVDGSMTLGGRVASFVEGDPPVSVAGTVSGRYDLGGSASKILISGTVRFDLTAEAPGIPSIPLEFSVSGDAGHFSPSFASCNRVTGDLSTETERRARELGVNASIDAAFVALPAAARDVDHVIEQYSSLIEVFKGLLERTRKGTLPTYAELTALAEQAEELNRTVHTQSPCAGGPGSGTGIRDPILEGLVSELMLELLTHWHEDLSVEQIIELLMITGRLGLSEEVEDAFVEELAARVALIGQQVADDMELKQLVEIYTVAQMLGLEDLAALAKRELGNYVTVGGGGSEPVDA